MLRTSYFQDNVNLNSPIEHVSILDNFVLIYLDLNNCFFNTVSHIILDQLYH